MEIDVHGDQEAVSRSQKGHPIYGFDGPRGDRPIFGFHPEKGHPVCASRRPNSERPCFSDKRMANGRCRRHGGKSLRGMAHPNYKTGEHSVYVPPPSLLADYDRLADHPELIEHRASIALLDAIINELLGEYEEGGGKKVWRAVKRIFKKVEVAWDKRDWEGLAQALTELGEAIEAGSDRSAVRAEMVGLVDARRKAVNSEFKREEIAAQTYTVEQMTAAMQVIGIIAGRYVPEEHKEAFFKEFTDYLGPRLRHRHPQLLPQGEEHDAD